MGLGSISFWLISLFLLSFFFIYYYFFFILSLSIICPFELRVRFVNFHLPAKTWLAASSYLAAPKWAASHRSKQTGSMSLSLAALTLPWQLQRGRGGGGNVQLVTSPERLIPCAETALSKA